MKTLLLLPGAPLHYPVIYQAPEGMRMEIKLGRAPDGTRLAVDDEGVLFLDWQSSGELTGETIIEIMARSVDTGKILETRYLLIRAIQPPPVEPTPEVQLGPFAEQHLIAGDAWLWNVHVDFARPDLVEVMAKDLPEGATLTQEFRGAHVLRWTPEKDQLGVHFVTLQAELKSDPESRAEAPLLIEVRLPGSEFSSGQEQYFNDPDLPVILPMPNRVVSAGRVVSFKVSALIGDVAAESEQVLLEVDRLPVAASFDENDNGSYTFHWRTNDRDEGEHLFRFRAINRLEPHLTTHQNVLIVVGDPSRSKTTPEDYMGMHDQHR